MTTPQKGNSGASVRGGPAPKSGQAMTKPPHAMCVRPTGHIAPNNAIITRRAMAAAQKKMQRAMLQDAVKNGGKTARKLGSTAAQAVKTVGRGVASAVSSILTTGSGTVVLVLILTVLLVAAIVAFPFGILFPTRAARQALCRSLLRWHRSIMISTSGWRLCKRQMIMILFLLTDKPPIGSRCWRCSR